MCVQTLMDPDKRAAYDALMGFTSGAMNPFNDKSYTPDKVFVSEYDCIGALISLTQSVTAKCWAANQVRCLAAHHQCKLQQLHDMPC